MRESTQGRPRANTTTNTNAATPAVPPSGIFTTREDRISFILKLQSTQGTRRGGRTLRHARGATGAIASSAAATMPLQHATLAWPKRTKTSASAVCRGMQADRESAEGPRSRRHCGRHTTKSRPAQRGISTRRARPRHRNQHAATSETHSGQGAPGTPRSGRGTAKPRRNVRWRRGRGGSTGQAGALAECLSRLKGVGVALLSTDPPEIFLA